MNLRPKILMAVSGRGLQKMLTRKIPTRHPINTGAVQRSLLRMVKETGGKFGREKLLEITKIHAPKYGIRLTVLWMCFVEGAMFSAPGFEDTLKGGAPRSLWHKTCGKTNVVLRVN